MKKLSVFLLLVVLILTLTACNNPEKTVIEARWNNYERHVFTISKASALLDASNEDRLLREPLTGYEPDLEKMDEVIPEDIAGTYTMTISVENDKCTFSTSQVLYVAYPTSLVESFSIWNTPDENGNTLSAMVAPQEENPFADLDGFTTLKSETETEVVFSNDATQRPYSSKNSVKGFYIGKEDHQSISKYELETSYNWNEKNNKVTITVNGETMSTKGRYAEKFIDANQLLLYIRSLDKRSTSFQDSPAVIVYMPKEDKVVTASFAYSYLYDTIITVDGEEFTVQLSAVSAIVDGTAILMQLNVPDTVNDNEQYLDSMPYYGDDLYKYSTLRFRSGIYSYHIADFSSLENGEEIFKALTETLG